MFIVILNKWPIEQKIRHAFFLGDSTCFTRVGNINGFPVPGSLISESNGFPHQLRYIHLEKCFYSKMFSISCVFAWPAIVSLRRQAARHRVYFMYLYNVIAALYLYIYSWCILCHDCGRVSVGDTHRVEVFSGRSVIRSKIVEGLELFQTPCGNWFVGLCGNRFVDLCGNRFVGLCGNRFMGLYRNWFMGLCGDRFVGLIDTSRPSGSIPSHLT